MKGPPQVLVARISPGSTRWLPGAERRLVPENTNHKPQTAISEATQSSRGGGVVRSRAPSPVSSGPYWEDNPLAHAKPRKRCHSPLHTGEEMGESTSTSALEFP